jgi:hypothetical protein
MPPPVYASIVFLKIPEFGQRPVTEQARLRAQLEAVLAVTAAELEPRGRLVLDASDGAAIVVLHDPVGALRLAERALAAVAAGLPLSIGINHGAVRPADSENGAEGMAGDGIAVAANAAAFAAASQILLSRSFRDALAEASPGEEATLVPAGTFADAGLRNHELFRRDRRAARRRSRRFAALAAAAALALVAAGVGVRVSLEGKEAFVDRFAAKYRDTTEQGGRRLRGWMEKVKF